MRVPKFIFLRIGTFLEEFSVEIEKVGSSEFEFSSSEFSRETVSESDFSSPSESSITIISSFVMFEGLCETAGCKTLNTKCSQIFKGN